ncbi:jmjC domain containing protein, partial [Aphelenchoides avenae]
RRANSPIEPTADASKRKRKGREVDAETLLATWKHLTEKTKKEVDELWAASAPNLFAEKQHNAKCARQYPHCSVCQYFVPFKKIRDTSAESPTKMPSRSHRYVTNQMFFKDEALPETTVCGVPEDDLYECANCRMVVHGQCYSAKALYRDQPDPEVAGPSRESREWLCERCRDHDDVTVRMATCHLCELRGGALLKVVTSAGERYFVHVVCALMHRRTKFVTAHSRASPFTYPTALLGQAATAMLSEKQRLPDAYLGEPSTFKIVESPRRYECEVCGLTAEGLLHCGLCDEMQMQRYFHTTCARVAHFTFERRDWPTVTMAVCPLHGALGTESMPEPLPPAKLNDVVVIDFETQGTHIIARGKVVDIAENLFCTVDFLDGSTSNDIYLSDIKHCQCKKKRCGGKH